MASTTTKTTGDKLLDRIGDQYAMLRDLRKQERKALRKLAELLKQAGEHPDRHVNYSTAAARMGTVRSYTQGLVRKLDAGQLDDDA